VSLDLCTKYKQNHKN